MMPSQPEQRLVELLDTIIDGAYSEQDRDEFSRLLDEHPELTQLVVQQLRTHSLLHWTMAPTAAAAPSALGPSTFGPSSLESSSFGPSSFGPPLAPPPHPARPAEQDPPEAGPSPRGRRRASAAALALAASLALVAGAYTIWGSALWGSGLWRSGGALVGAKAPVGKIVALNDANYSPGAAALTLDDEVVPGVLELESGSVTVEFFSGAKLELDGPARCAIETGKLVRLLRGQATADAPRWARGFTIATPDIEVIDLGTRFGVAKRDDGKTDVVVFEGKVDLKSLAHNERRFERRLTQGEAARIDRDGQIERIFHVHSDALGNNWSTFEHTGAHDVIAAVWDNLGATKSVSYYRLVDEGLVEDAPAYVDHPHQWNGVTEEGLPGFLRGADYVRTMNDYRYLGELAIHVELAADANLYVLFDRRVTPPEWLTSQFVDTGARVGLDEDAWEGNPTFKLETGPGKSVDNVFSVWRRECARGEELTLGAVGPGGEARAMYGIAATPR